MGGASFFRSGVAFAPVREEAPHFIAIRPITGSFNTGLRISADIVLSSELIDLPKIGTLAESAAVTLERAGPSIAMGVVVSPHAFFLLRRQFLEGRTNAPMIIQTWISSARGDFCATMPRFLPILDMFVSSVAIARNTVAYGYLRELPP